MSAGSVRHLQLRIGSEPAARGIDPSQFLADLHGRGGYPAAISGHYDGAGTQGPKLGFSERAGPGHSDGLVDRAITTLPT